MYLDRFIEFDHFFVRKVMPVKDSSAFLVMPGGFGTLDEAFGIAMLKQTQWIEHLLLVAVDQRFLEPLIDSARDATISEGTSNPEDARFVHLADTAENVVRLPRRTSR